MNYSRQEGNIYIYDDLTEEDLHSLLEQGIITIAEFFKCYNEGMLEKDNIKIYFTDKRHAGNSRII